MIKINCWRHLTNIEFLRLSFSVMYLIVLIWGSLTFLKTYLNISCVERYLWVLIVINFICFIEQNIHVIYKTSSLATYLDKFAQN